MSSEAVVTPTEPSVAQIESASQSDATSDSGMTEPLIPKEDLPPAYQPSAVPYQAAPVMVVAVQEPSSEWQTSLLGCCADLDAAKTTAKTILCPCVAYGSSRDRLMHQAIHGMPHPTEGNTCSPICGAYAVILTMPHFGPIAAAMLRTIQRTQLRTVFGIPGNVFKDCMASTFCGPCSLIQTRRELDIRERDGQVALIIEEESPLVDAKTSPPSYTV